MHVKLLPLMVVGPRKAVRRDPEIVPIGIYQPEVFQPPGLRSNVRIQRAPLADDEVSFFLQIFNFYYDLDTFVRPPIAFFFLECL